VGRGALERLALTELLDEPADERALRAKDAGLDAGVVADRYVRRLHRADRAVRVLADVDVPVVDVGADPVPVRVETLRNEVLEDADNTGHLRLDEPQADVDRRRAVALERADLDRRVAGVLAHEAAGPCRVDPLGVLLPPVEDVRLTDEAILDEGI